MPAQTLRWGILSTANIGRAAVIPALHASDRGVIGAVASRDRSQAEAFAEANGIPTAYGKYERLLEDPEIDALYIPLPNSMHLEWTCRALEAGKHVLCEKPLALTAEDCMEMARVAKRVDRRLMEAFMYRFHPRTERLVEMVEAGEVGQPKMIRSTFTFRLTKPDNIRLDPDLGGGALRDVGCYCVNVSRTIAGREPTGVRADAAWTGRGVDQELTGTLFFSDGLVARFDCALTVARCEQVEVAGTEGWVRVPRAFLPGTDNVSIELHRGRGEQSEIEVEGVDEYTSMVDHFAACVLESRPFRYEPEEAARNMKVIEALYVSAHACGQRVELD